MSYGEKTRSQCMGSDCCGRDETFLFYEVSTWAWFRWTLYTYRSAISFVEIKDTELSYAVYTACRRNQLFYAARCCGEGCGGFEFSEKINQGIKNSTGWSKL